MNIENMRVSRKLSVAFAAILVVVIAFCSIAFVSMKRINDATIANQQTQNALTVSGQILATLVEHQNAMRGYVSSLNEEFIGRMTKHGEAVPPLIAELQDSIEKAQADKYLPLLRQAISTAAREQATGLAEINTAINQMDQFTQQNAAMVEETNAASAGLATESARLRELVRRFQLNGSQAPISATGGIATTTRRVA